MARWAYMVAVLLVAAVAANTQCDALCLSSLCKTTTSCHHSSDSPNCHYRLSSSAGVEATPDLATIPVISSPVTMAYLPERRLLAGVGQPHSRLLERGSPPGSFPVLRI